MDGFEILKQLGKGSFSLVLVAKRKEDNKIYAIKRVQISNMSNKEKLNALNEVRLLSSINHQNIIGYKESFYDEPTETLNMVLEYAEGGDLRSKIQSRLKSKRYFKETEIWAVFIQLITGLRYLHGHNIVHRDLKTANIFITRNNIYKLGDLNVSKIAKSGMLYTQTGTPYYASPEVWEEKPYDIKSDIWSIGCILYEMCCLTPPFKGKNLQLVYQNIIKGRYAPIPAFYSKDLVNMVHSLLQVNPKDRPTCTEMFKHSVIRNKIHNIYGQINDDEWNCDKSRNEYKYNNVKEYETEFMNTIRISNDKEIKRVLPTMKRYNSNNIRHMRCTSIITKMKVNGKGVINGGSVDGNKDKNEEYEQQHEHGNDSKTNGFNVIKNNGSNISNKNDYCIFKRNKSSSNYKPNINSQLETIKHIEDYKSKGNNKQTSIIPISIDDNSNSNNNNKIEIIYTKQNLERSHTPLASAIPISCQSLRGLNMSKINQMLLLRHGRNIRIQSNSLSKLEHLTEDSKNENSPKQDDTHITLQSQQHDKEEESKHKIEKKKSCDCPKPPKPHSCGKVLQRQDSAALKLTINPFQIMDNPNIRKILPSHMQTKLPKVRCSTNNSTINSSGNNTLETSIKK